MVIFSKKGDTYYRYLLSSYKKFIVVLADNRGQNENKIHYINIERNEDYGTKLFILLEGK